MSRLFSTKRPNKKGCFLFKEHLKEAIKQAVKTAKPAAREICGAIVSDGCRLQLVRLKNKTKRPGSFSMTYRQMRKVGRSAKKLNQHLVGTFHSHPFSSAEPGEGDLKGAFHGRQLMLIIDCQSREAKLWWIEKRKARPVPLQIIKNSE